MDQIFFIHKVDEAEFKKILKDYYKFIKSKPEKEAESLVKSKFGNLLAGLDLEGQPIEDKYFDELFAKALEGFYAPIKSKRKRYVRGQKNKVEEQKTKIRSSDEVAIENIKKNLLSEYPLLDRKDLQTAVDNYCTLVVKVKHLMGNAGDNHIGIKNLMDTMIRLGTYLGINEEKKAQQKAFEDKKSIASLAEQFQETLKVFPDLMDRMRYKELRILLAKYERKEISRNIFMLPAYAGVSPEEARAEVRTKEKEYEA